jgi:hypothetical protein
MCNRLNHYFCLCGSIITKYCIFEVTKERKQLDFRSASIPLTKHTHDAFILPLFFSIIDRESRDTFVHMLLRLANKLPLLFSCRVVRSSRMERERKMELFQYVRVVDPILSSRTVGVLLRNRLGGAGFVDQSL